MSSEKIYYGKASICSVCGHRTEKARTYNVPKIVCLKCQRKKANEYGRLRRERLKKLALNK